MTNSKPRTGIQYGRRERMRVALSTAARDLSESAAALVPTDSDAWAYQGELIQDAKRLLGAANYLLTLAVACERHAGVSWATVGDALGDISRQSAHDRYAKELGRYERAMLLSWLKNETDGAGLPDGAGDTAKTAASLDRWLAARRATGEIRDQVATVTGGIKPISLAEEAVLGLAAAAYLTRLGPDVPADELHELRVALSRRTIAHYERVIAHEPVMESARRALAAERAALAELEANPPT